jgi:hypothetical protein
MQAIKMFPKLPTSLPPTSQPTSLPPASLPTNAAEIHYNT